MTAVENEIPVSNLVKKTTIYDKKLSEIEKKLTGHDHDKYVTTPEFQKFRVETFAARLEQATLVTKTDFGNRLISLNLKTFSNKTKHVFVENEFEKLQTFDLSYFWGKSHFEEDEWWWCAKISLVIQPINKYFTSIIGVGSGKYIYFWKCNGLYDEGINSITVSNYSISSELSYYSNIIRVKFIGSSLKQDKRTYSHGEVVKIYTVFEISINFNISSCTTLENCLFGEAILAKNNDIDEWKYSGYGIGFDRKWEFSIGNGFGITCIIFGVDMSYSVDIDNKKKIF